MAYVDEENGFYVGNVGQIYELRQVGEKKRSVIDFSVACSPRYRDDNGQMQTQAEPTWINVTAWGALAENIASTLRKGARVMVKGQPAMKDEYTKPDGTVIPPRPYLVADFVGPELFFGGVSLAARGGAHEDGHAVSPRPAAGNSSGATKTAPAAVPAAKKKVDDEFNIDGFELDDEQPF